MLRTGSLQGMQNSRKSRSPNTQLQTDLTVWELPVLGTCFQEGGPLETSKEHLLSGSFMLSQNQDEIA